MQLPKTTEFRKRIPKQTFYENLNISPAVKRDFVEQIRIIYWRNKIAPTTVNVAPGKTVTEVEVFEIRLTGQELDEAVLRRIDMEIPYHILFLLEYEGKYQAVIGYKEAASNTAFKVTGYYRTDWMPLEELPLQLEGLDMDAVYEQFVRQIASDALAAPSGESLSDSVRRDEQRKKLQKQIDALQAKIRREKQLNRQVEMRNELRKLRHEFEGAMNEIKQ